MRVLFIISVIALAVTACSKPAPIETVESLVTNPDRLKELRAQCKTDHAKVGDAQCNAVAEATRQRFMRATPSPYANDPVRPPLPPASTPAVKDGPP